MSLLCRYFKYELLVKGAITKEDLPIFLSARLDKSNTTCMFSAAQLRTSSTSHLTGGVGTSIVHPVSLLPLNMNLESQGRQLESQGLKW